MKCLALERQSAGPREGTVRSNEVVGHTYSNNIIISGDACQAIGEVPVIH